MAELLKPNQPQPNFAGALAFGKIGEGHIATWLRAACKYNVLPVYEKEIHEGKGPVLFPSNSDPLIAPDLFVFRSVGKEAEKVRWIEAKTKSAFSWHRITSRWVTGIDVHHYEHYRQVANLYPWQVWLLFLHLNGQAKDSPSGCPTGLFGGELVYLSEHENHRHDNWGKSGMVYWAHDQLRKLATLEEVYATMPDGDKKDKAA